jgi:hypothetical protein
MMTAKQFLSTAVICATVTSIQMHAQDAVLFPSLNDYSDETIRLHGLAQLFPNRVLFEHPELAAAAQSQVATRVEDLPHSIKYIRLYRLDEAHIVLSELKAHPALILDLRFLKCNNTAVDSLGLFADFKQRQQLTTIGDCPDDLNISIHGLRPPQHLPVIVLCNRETAGPFEAVLHQLQTNAAIIAVGEPTAGRTGFYHKVAPHAWMLCGEIRPHEDTSLVGSGLQPDIQLEIDAEENYLSYHLYEAGTNITQLLRRDKLQSESNKVQDERESTFIKPDRILQRGVDIITALQTLQQQPEF